MKPEPQVFFGFFTPKQKFKCLLTELKYCREDLVVQEDYNYCLNNLSFTVKVPLTQKMFFSLLKVLI
jgi:hypothetical protein